MAAGVMSKLAGVFGGNIGDSVSKIVGLFKVSPELVEEHKFELEKIQAELVSKQLDAASLEVQAASSNIQAEEKSGDKYTERSRPTFIYMCEVILAFNCIFVPAWQMFTKQPITFLPLPHELYWLFGSCVLGYTGASHWSDFMQLPGQSSISLPFGIAMSNDDKTNKEKK